MHIRQRIEQLLPEIIRRTLPSTGDPHDPLDDNPLNLFVEVMALLHAPSATTLDHLHEFFDVYHAPEPFVTFMASWFDLQALWIDSLYRYNPGRPPAFPAGNGRVRQLLASIRELTQWRGTAYGLTRFLEIATGLTGFVITEGVLDADGEAIPFHIRVELPPAAAPYRALAERIIRTERPAYVTYELVVVEMPVADTPSG